MHTSTSLSASKGILVPENTVTSAHLSMPPERLLKYLEKLEASCFYLSNLIHCNHKALASRRVFALGQLLGISHREIHHVAVLSVAG